MKINSDSFWPSYTDLMTSLFFIMLVLFVLTYVSLKSTIKLQKENHDYYGFKVNDGLYWYWMAENINYDDETYKGYLESYPKFYKEFHIKKIK